MVAEGPKIVDEAVLGANCKFCEIATKIVEIASGTKLESRRQLPGSDHPVTVLTLDYHLYENVS